MPNEINFDGELASRIHNELNFHGELASQMPNDINFDGELASQMPYEKHFLAVWQKLTDGNFFQHLFLGCLEF